MIDSVERGIKIHQNKTSIAPPIDHRQQVIFHAKKGGLSAMTSSVGRLKLDMLSPGSWTSTAGSTPGGSYLGPWGPRLTVCAISLPSERQAEEHQ